MTYLIKRYYKITKDNEVSSSTEVVESELDTLEFSKTIKSKTNPVNVEVYKLVAQLF